MSFHICGLVQGLSGLGNPLCEWCVVVFNFLFGYYNSVNSLQNYPLAFIHTNIFIHILS